ncbi:MAG: NAD+ synthase [archaeon]
MKPEEKYKKLVEKTKKFFEKQRFQKAVLGLSGGIDSSLTAKIVSEAIGKENVFGLIMPEKTNSPESAEYAKELAEKLGIKAIEVDINDFFKPFFKLLPWEQNRTSKTNLKPRIRMTVLYNYANKHNAIVVGTSNKTELMLGYFTKFGDGASDFLPIGNLFKTEVIEISKTIGIPEKIIQRKPSAELEEDQTDEKDLGLSYKEIDEILREMEKEKTEKQLTEKFGEKAEKLIKRIKENRHKTEKTEKIEV